MGQHATADELRKLRRRELDAIAIVTLTRHLAVCESCAVLARSNAGGTSLVAAMRQASHPDLEEELFPYVDGTLDAERSQWIEEHLRDCKRCTEDVADARWERARLRRGPRRMVAWSAVAAAAVGAFIVITLRRQPAPVIPKSHPVRVALQAPLTKPDEWSLIVSRALTERKLDPPPVWIRARREPETLRGTGTAEHVTLAPEAVVVATTTPRFHWPSRGVERAVVSVYDGRDLVAKSSPTASSSWTPEKPLARGRTYAWQVELTSGNERRVMPQPPDPPAMFSIVDETSWNEIERARRERPADHLLLAILEARAGLKRDSLDDFAKASDPRASALEESVRHW
jgi:anti-sigma factor RsiW